MQSLGRGWVLTDQYSVLLGVFFLHMQRCCWRGPKEEGWKIQGSPNEEI